MKKIMKRTICMVMAMLIFSMTIIGTTSDAMAATYNGVNYSTDYRTWKQSDPAWSGKKLGNNGTIGAWGCLLTSISILMCKAGVENANSFNPGVLRDRYENAGYISHAWTTAADGNLSASAYSKANSPKFYSVGWSDFHPTPYQQIYNDIANHLSKGQYAVVCVNYGGHYVAVDYCKNGEVYICDPARSGKTRLRQYDGGIEHATYFEKGAATKVPTPTNRKIYGKGMNYPRTLKYKKCFSVRGTISSAYQLTSVTVAVYDTSGRMKTGITINPKAKSFDIRARADRYVYFNKLKRGTYYYRIKVKNSAGVGGTLLSKKFKIK